MVRRYMPTGRPRGRPAKKPFDPQKIEAMVEHIGKLAVAAAGAPGETPEQIDQALAEIAKPVTPAANLNTMVAFMTKEELAKQADLVRSQIAQAVANFHHKVPETLERLGKYEPEKALKLYIELLEYQVPKLTRQEMVGQVQHTHNVFVVQREEGPPAIDATFVEVK